MKKTLLFLAISSVFVAGHAHAKVADYAEKVHSASALIHSVSTLAKATGETEGIQGAESVRKGSTVVEGLLSEAFDDGQAKLDLLGIFINVLDAAADTKTGSLVENWNRENEKKNVSFAVVQALLKEFGGYAVEKNLVNQYFGPDSDNEVGRRISKATAHALLDTLIAGVITTLQNKCYDRNEEVGMASLKTFATSLFLNSLKQFAGHLLKRELTKEKESAEDAPVLAIG